ncbi:FMN-binding negative transcriptional regulator [Actinocorallia populi]|uniref:FMN-binding negative transcriptional regulator n=1 Tax=Actinocorallia populi TaxID=2079200 RepID=UPI000D095DE5|nr:FMN-binding negative transcriptional regulator [Actinocorallia populi]
MTYVPERMPQPSRARAAEFAKGIGFGSVFVEASRLAVAHVPIQVVLDEGTGLPAEVVFHFSVKNELVGLLAGSARALLVFRGPDGYISPRWYDQESFPTWDYAFVHMTGLAGPVAEARLRRHIKDLVERFDPGLAFGEEFIDRYIGGIRGFSMSFPEVEPLFKLSQDKNEASVNGVLRGLRRRGESLDGRLADAIEAVRR